MHPNDRVKTAMDAYAFGVSAALQELGMDKEAADELAIKEAATPQALKKVMETASKGGRAVKDYASRAGNLATKAKFTASGAKGKATDIAKSVSEKVRGAGSSAAEKAMGVGRGAKDVAQGATGTGKSFGRKLAPWEGSKAHQFGAQNRKAIGAGAAGLGAAGGAGAAYAAMRKKDKEA